MTGNLHKPDTKDETEFVEPANLRVLRRLVTGLMLVLGAGMIIITATIVLKLNEAPKPRPSLVVTADHISIAAGEEITAIGGDGKNLIVVVQSADGTQTIRSYAKDSGEELSRINIERDQ